MAWEPVKWPWRSLICLRLSRSIKIRAKPRPLRLELARDGVKRGAIIAEAGKRIAAGELPNLFEKAGIIEQRAAQDQGIAAGTQRQSQSERRVKGAQRLRGRHMACDVDPQRHAERTLEAKAHRVGAAKGDRRHQEERRRNQLRSASQPSCRMSGDVD